MNDDFLVKVQKKHLERFEEELRQKNEKEKNTKIRTMVNKKWTSYVSRRNRNRQIQPSKKKGVKRVVDDEMSSSGNTKKIPYTPKQMSTKSLRILMDSPESGQRQPIETIQNMRDLEDELDL